MYIVRKYKILFVRDLEICRKVSLCRVQMRFIFSDNVHILQTSHKLMVQLDCDIIGAFAITQCPLCVVRHKLSHLNLLLLNH
jgi:hypothetical protein